MANVSKKQWKDFSNNEKIASVLMGVALFVILAWMFNVLGNGTADIADTQTTNTSTAASQSQTASEEATAVDTETTAQKNAVGSAQSYLAYQSFSRQGLIDQLVYEQYSTEDATYAVDKLNVDWNEQAVKSAQSYLEYSSFSYQGLIDQLVYEKYTTAQATYGADAAYN